VILCTKPAENGDRRRGRTKLRCCDELEDDAQVGAETGELTGSEERNGGKSLRRSRRTRGYCNNGRRKII
jgi:hypothetical protein